MQKILRFKDKVIIVTGGASGIGRATCLQVAAEGGKIAIVDIDDKGKNTAEEISRQGGEAFFIQADIGVEGDVRDAVKAVIARWEKIDVLVNNAAVMTFKTLEDLTVEEWDRVMNVNLKAAFLFCKYCIPHIKNGTIVNVSSVHAHKPEAMAIPYSASKAALEALTKGLSIEYEPHRLRVFGVSPGGVDTPMLWNNPTIQAMRREDVVYTQPEEIASLICQLASEVSLITSGTTLTLDNKVHFGQ